MKVILTGGGTGGHFYPIIAVAEAIRDEARAQRLVNAKLYYLSTTPYNERMLYDNDIQFIKITAGKRRRYASVKNFFDIFKTAFGAVGALWTVFRIFPDVVFGKGGYASFPALLAARLFRIPVIIHESDSAPGKVNGWAGKFARRIAISYPEAAAYFPKDKTALTGNPIRKAIMQAPSEGAHSFLGLDGETPVLVVLGGSQGSEAINNAIIEALPELVKRYYIIHQTGKSHFEEIKNTAGVVLENSEYTHRYKPFPYLNDSAMRMAAGAATLVVSRSGSSIFELAHWGVPSIIIPIPESVSHDQTKNAFNYARTGAAIVIEEANLAAHILLAEIKRLIDSPDQLAKMRESAKAFDYSDAASKIAKEIIQIALEHA